MATRRLRALASRARVASLRMPPSAPPPAMEFDVFLTPEAFAINHARLAHLATLPLDLDNKRVLEVGAGIGLHTAFFEDRGCSVLSTDGSERNVGEIARRHPHRDARVLDLDHVDDLTPLGEFDVVYCYGTLYHLREPARAIAALARVCKEVMLVETCVSLGAYPELHLVREPDAQNMAVSSVGCRPTRAWVMETLRENFPHAYVTRTQPNYPDFDLDWSTPGFQLVHRSVFVGSKRELAHPDLLSEIPMRQEPCLTERPAPPAFRASTTSDPATGPVWLDVGAHEGQRTLEHAKADPSLTVYAFEANPQIAARTIGAAPNFNVLAMAVWSRDGFAQFHVNAYEGASSLLALDEDVRRQWVGGEVLKEQCEIWVPTVRLDTFLAAMGIRAVDWLKIDAQGADFDVLLSAGSRLRDIREITIEVATTAVPLYQGASDKTTIVDFLAAHGFELVDATAQTHDQEEDLTFRRVG